MNTASDSRFPAPTLCADSGFFDQCTSLAKAMLARLEVLVQSPSIESAPSVADLRNLDRASRILKRIQDTYLSARRAQLAREALPACKPSLAAMPTPLKIPENVSLPVQPPSFCAEHPCGAVPPLHHENHSPALALLPKAISVVPPAEDCLVKQAPISAAPTVSPFPIPVPSHARSSARYSPAVCKNPLPDTAMPASSLYPATQSSSVLDPVEKILASVDALRARYAACTLAESPFIERLM